MQWIFWAILGVLSQDLLFRDCIDSEAWELPTLRPCSGTRFQAQLLTWPDKLILNKQSGSLSASQTPKLMRQHLAEAQRPHTCSCS